MAEDKKLKNVAAKKPAAKKTKVNTSSMRNEAQEQGPGFGIEKLFLFRIASRES